MKIKIDDIDSLPSKRLYLSIIADYDTKTALCELIDNAIDNWMFQGKLGGLTISLTLDYDRQIIQVNDNSGGVRKEDIKLIVSPGHTRNEGSDSIIGIFGVGSKRAVVALAEEVKIFTRYKKEETILIEINDEWIRDESWDVPAFYVNNIQPGSTKIELTKLRNQIQLEQEPILIDHLRATYALLLKSENINLTINGKKIAPTLFESWSFPPNYGPKQIHCELDFQEKGKVKVELLGGLTRSGDPSGGEYGAYFYCNNRLISRAYKGAEVGFRPLKIGQPHPAVALARAIVRMNGPAQLMPWNSSKSEINFKHPAFHKVQSHIEQLLTHYATLSRKWSIAGGWEENVFKYSNGQIKTEKLEDISTRVFLPVIHRVVHQTYPDIIKKANKSIAIEKPWVKGLYEAIIAVNELPKLKLEQNNRLSLLILDSTLEISFKDFLIYDSGLSFSESRLSGIMKDRSQVHAEIKKVTQFKKGVWERLEYFYKLRCELVHKRASVNISDEDLRNFRDTVEYILNKMFKISFK